MERFDKLLDSVRVGHVIVVVASLIGAALGARYYPTLPFWHRVLNVCSGFVTASLIGLGFVEAGWSVPISSGLAYVGGHLGNWVMDGLIVMVKFFVGDPWGFLVKAIELIERVLSVAKTFWPWKK